MRIVSADHFEIVRQQVSTKLALPDFARFLALRFAAAEPRPFGDAGAETGRKTASEPANSPRNGEYFATEWRINQRALAFAVLVFKFTEAKRVLPASPAHCRASYTLPGEASRKGFCWQGSANGSVNRIRQTSVSAYKLGRSFVDTAA